MIVQAHFSDHRSVECFEWVGCIDHVLNVLTVLYHLVPLPWFSLVKYKRKYVTVHAPGEISSLGFSTTSKFPAAAAAPSPGFSPGVH